MKKLIALILALVMSLTLFAACGAEKETTPTTTEATTEGTEPVDTTEGTEAPAEIKTVKEGKLIMATNAYFPPYEFYEGDKIVGIDAEIAAAIAEKLVWSWRSAICSSTPSSPQSRKAALIWVLPV